MHRSGQKNSWNNVLPNFLKPILVFQNDRLAWVAATALNLPESHLSVSYWSHRPTIQPTIVYNSIWNICKRISPSSPCIVNLLKIIEKYCLMSTTVQLKLWQNSRAKSYYFHSMTLAMIMIYDDYDGAVDVDVDSGGTSGVDGVVNVVVWLQCSVMRWQ